MRASHRAARWPTGEGLGRRHYSSWGAAKVGRRAQPAGRGAWWARGPCAGRPSRRAAEAFLLALAADEGLLDARLHARHAPRVGVRAMAVLAPYYIALGLVVSVWLALDYTAGLAWVSLWPAVGS